MFKVTKIDLGSIKARKEITIEFPYEGINQITRMESPCDCTVPYDIPSSGIIRIKYTPKSVPTHILAKGRTSYSISKSITIDYKDSLGKSKHEELTFTATISD